MRCTYTADDKRTCILIRSGESIDSRITVQRIVWGSGMRESPIAGQHVPVLGCGSIFGRAHGVPPAAEGPQPPQLLVPVLWVVSLLCTTVFHL